LDEVALKVLTLGAAGITNDPGRLVEPVGVGALGVATHLFEDEIGPAGAAHAEINWFRGTGGMAHHPRYFVIVSRKRGH
jgi:hypothetical protein